MHDDLNDRPGAPERAAAARVLEADLGPAVIEAAPDAILLVAADGTIAFANRAAEAMLGYARADLLGMPVELLVPEHLRDSHESHRARFAREPRNRPMGAGLQLSARRADGSYLPVEISLNPMGADGAAVAIVRDVRERARAEHQLQRLHRLLDASSDGVLVFDAGSLRFTYVNQGAVDQLGWSRAQLLELTPVDLLCDHDEASVRAVVAPLLTGGMAVRSLTATQRTRDGAEVPVEILFQAPPDADGSRSACMAHVRDLTERRRTEEELSRARDALVRAEDRDRIARDLHDTVIQQLFATGLHLQGVVARHPEASGDLEQAVDDLDATIKQIRTLIFALHAPSVAGETDQLRRQVLTITREAARVLGHEPRVVFDGAVDTTTPAAVRDQVGPVLQEALTNVARHARARATEVHVAVTGGELHVRVLDDGVGLQATESCGGRGLENLRARARVLGGRCELGERPGGGTIVDWHVPIS